MGGSKKQRKVEDARPMQSQFLHRGTTTAESVDFATGAQFGWETGGDCMGSFSVF